MSYKFIIKSKKLLKRILAKIENYNSDINQYTASGKTISIPSLAFRNFAEDLYKAGRGKEAEKFLINASSFVTKSSDALIDLGNIKQKEGNIDAAISYYENACVKSPDNVKAYCMLGSCFTFLNRFEQAEEVLKKAVEIDDKDCDIYLAWGILLLKTKKYSEAKEKFDLSAKYNFNDARSLYMSAVTEIELGNFDIAQEKLKTIIECTENNYEAMHNLAYVYFRKKDYKSALVYAKMSLDIYQNKPETYLLLGDIYAESGEISDTIETYETALKRGLNNNHIYLSYGNNLQRFKRYEEAIPMLEKAIEGLKDDTDSYTLAILSKCHYYIGNHEKSLDLADESISKDDKNSIAHEIKGRIYFDKKNYTLAFSEFKTALKTSEFRDEICLMLAKINDAIGNFNDSDMFFKKAVEYNPKNIDIQVSYINSLINRKDYKTADVKIISALKVFKEDETLLNLHFLANYHLAKENFYRYNIEETLKIAKKIEDNYPNSFLYLNEKNELTEVLNNK